MGGRCIRYTPWHVFSVFSHIWGGKKIQQSSLTHTLTDINRQTGTRAHTHRARQKKEGESERKRVKGQPLPPRPGLESCPGTHMFPNVLGPLSGHTRASGGSCRKFKSNPYHQPKGWRHWRASGKSAKTQREKPGPVLEDISAYLLNLLTGFYALNGHFFFLRVCSNIEKKKTHFTGHEKIKK